ncbi:PREDICTED: uncharacterized protein LOC105145980 [Acromyrmex echinatior]|uniref:uncharacterized protein LOC105145980 n=1 Tax=Acromyrmex echinatior TaxID=103372 RepID=UPI000580D4B7|nr:PREDICTED: uncharacterized protein LOC105145980 [Acromyrmex echinatior]
MLFSAKSIMRGEQLAKQHATISFSSSFFSLSLLTADAVSFPEYLCHGTWVENDTAYLVASTDVGRYCLVYSASAATTGSRELSVTGHLASCPRASHRYPVSWQVNLTSYAQCGDVSSGTTWALRVPMSLLYIVFLGALLARYIAR